MNEDQNIEYKQSWRDEYLKWICGFCQCAGWQAEKGRSVVLLSKCGEGYQWLFCKNRKHIPQSLSIRILQGSFIVQAT